MREVKKRKTSIFVKTSPKHIRRPVKQEMDEQGRQEEESQVRNVDGSIMMLQQKFINETGQKVTRSNSSEERGEPLSFLS